MVKLIENTESILNKINIFSHPKAKVQYLNQLMEVGFYAVNIGPYDEEVDQIVDLLNKKSTKIIVSLTTKEDFYKVVKNTKIDFMEIPLYLVREIDDISLISTKIILNSYINNTENNELKNLGNNYFYINKINLHDCAESINIMRSLQKFENNFSECELGINILSKKLSYRETFDYIYNSKFQFIEVSVNSWIDDEKESFIPTQKIISYLMMKKEKININVLALETAYNTAKKHLQNFNSF